MSTITVTRNLTTVGCYRCGTVFGIEESLHRRLVERGEMFWCPNGHAQCYTESEVKRLEKQLRDTEQNLRWATADAKRLLEQRNEAERSRAAVRGHFTKLKRRTAHGVCPVCQRTCSQMARHIKSKHPEYQAAAGIGMEAGT